MESHPYQHKRPRRPLRLSRRTEPPPEHEAPPNMTPFLIVGGILAAVMALLAMPYLISYLVQSLGV